MSGQKYKRTNFDDDDNTSLGGGTPPGITYDPALAFKSGAGFWQKRSTMERILLLLLLVAVTVLIVLIAVLASKHSELKEGTCGTERCGVVW